MSSGSTRPIENGGVQITRVSSEGAGVGPPDPKGLRWIATGAGLGLAASLAGVAVPVSLIFLATYSPANLQVIGPSLLQATGFFAMAGVLLFAVSLFAFRTGFAAFRKFEQRFWSSSVLCLVGTVGYVLLIVPAATALFSSDSLFQCVHASPALALSCLQSVAPLVGYTAIFAFWLVWLGQLGIVVGLAFTGRRFREPSLHLGTLLYALLLLVFIAPFIGLLFSSSALTSVLFAVVVLGLLAPAFVAYGSGRRPAYSNQVVVTITTTQVRTTPASERPEVEASAGTGI